ncbi:MAG TPA: carbamate kinase [Actinomycetota bacterium]|nr:carbamate kinase [Actinomycetota bacterium]
MRAVVALGGNAIVRHGQRGTVAQQRAAIAQAASGLGVVASRGIELVVTHGNGPQVGRLLLQNLAAQRRIPMMPLDVLGAESQAEIGYMLQQALSATLSPRPVATVITQTVVAAGDPAFADPTKPVGPSMLAPAARALEARGIAVARDEMRGGWRRVVASPRPLRLVEEAAIRALADAGITPIAAGGGGVPVIEEDGGYRGVDGVVDKDLAAAILARATEAAMMVILTDVEHVIVDRGTRGERSVGRMTVAEARERLEAGEFPAGSMGPKVEAVVQAAEEGRRAIITSLESVADAIEGTAGTEVVA